LIKVPVMFPQPVCFAVAEHRRDVRPMLRLIYALSFGFKLLQLW